jgi:hypothetical protein
MVARAARRKRAQPAKPPGIRPEPAAQVGKHGRFVGLTNDEALAVIVEELGGPPERGKLYRLRYGQGEQAEPAQCIAEYAGLANDYLTGRLEHALRFIIRNPALPADAKNGTREHPFILWPLDVDSIAPAEPGDLDTPLIFRYDDEPRAQPAPGRPPIQ